MTALCDGADNCWSIVDAVKAFCASITYILDWFHITMRFRNIAMPKTHKEDYESAKWSLWHGDGESCLEKLGVISGRINNTKITNKMAKLIAYLQNNQGRLVNYEQRKNCGLAFTSHMAEATVESLINQRCKGSQHMRWTREGVHPLLQIRSYVASNDWNRNWQGKVIGAMSKAA